MKKNRFFWLRPVLFTLGGVLLGLGYYYFFGCATGTCAITASPLYTAVYLGIVGLLLSYVFGKKYSCTCNK